MKKVRPYQHKNELSEQESIIRSDYISHFVFEQFEQKLDLITFLQLLVYVRTLNYQTKSLRSNFRLGDFLNYTNQTSNHYQLMKLKKFFDV